MSAVALKSLTSAAATTLYDAIGRAETLANLDELAKSLWRSHLVGAISEADATELVDYIESRRRRPHREVQRQETLPGFPLPDRNRERVSRIPKRRVQRSPDKQASYERRHRLAYSGVMPPHLAARLTISAMAVLRIVADEYRRAGRCELSLADIAARAGTCRKTAKLAMKEARDLRLISVTERPIPGQRHLPNLITVISLDWLKWLRRPAARNQAGGGGNLLVPTNKTLEDDSGDHRVQTAAPATAAQPKRGLPTKEALEFAAELANICGYRQAAVPRSWQQADPPQIVQIWLNELNGHRRPIEALRTVATTAMRRKQALSDASPPYSPRYFSAEVKKLVARSRLQPRRDPARRVA